MFRIQQKVNRLLTKAFLKKNVISLEELYGDKLKKLRLFPPETVATPEAVHLPLYMRSENLKSETYTTPDIYTAILDGILYSPEYNILLTKSRKIILESIHPLNLKLINFQLNLDSELWRNLYQLEVKKIPGYCSIFRSMRTGFAHTLIDNIPRVYLLNQPEYSDFKEIKLLCPNGMMKLENFFIPNLIPSNVVLTPVLSGYLYEIEKLIFPSFFHHAGACYFPSPYLEKLRSELMPRRPRKKNKRIFLSRINYAERTTKRHILNESELFEKLRNLGFERYLLEDMSLEAQVELFYDAETVVGAEGAGMCWTPFSEEAKVLVLFNRKVVTPYYYTIAKNVGHQYRHWCGNEKNLYSNFRVDVPKVIELLSSFSDDFN